MNIASIFSPAFFPNQGPISNGILQVLFKENAFKQLARHLLNTTVSDRAILALLSWLTKALKSKYVRKRFPYRIEHHMTQYKLKCIYVYLPDMFTKK